MCYSSILHSRGINNVEDVTIRWQYRESWVYYWMSSVVHGWLSGGSTVFHGLGNFEPSWGICCFVAEISRATEFTFFSTELSKFCKFTSKQMYLVSSLVPLAHLKSNQYLSSHFIRRSLISHSFCYVHIIQLCIHLSTSSLSYRLVHNICLVNN